MKTCIKCGESVTPLPSIVSTSHLTYYGCQPCNRVYEQTSDSITGQEKDFKPYYLSYSEYIENPKIKEELERKVSQYIDLKKN